MDTAIHPIRRAYQCYPPGRVQATTINWPLILLSKRSFPLFSDRGLRLAPTPVLKPSGTNAVHLQLRTNQLRANRMGGRAFPNADKRAPVQFPAGSHKSASSVCATAPNIRLSTRLSYRVVRESAVPMDGVSQIYLLGTAGPTPWVAHLLPNG